MRLVALCGKNYLFAASHEGAKRGLRLHPGSLHHVEPCDYLKGLLSRIADDPLTQSLTFSKKKGDQLRSPFFSKRTAGAQYFNTSCAA